MDTQSERVQQSGASSGLGALSPREVEVLGATALGLTNQQLATRLGVSVHAVKFHLASIYRKLEVTNRTEAVVLFVREGRPAPSAESVG